MPLNLPDGWVYDKVFGSPVPMQRAYKAKAGGLNQSLAMMPSAAGAQYGYDGSAAPVAPMLPDAMGEPADAAPMTDTSTLQADTASEAYTTVSSDVTPADRGDAQRSYPLLPLTVVPKPDVNPMVLLKAPHDVAQRLVIIALLLTILSAVTLVLWRFHRRDYASPRRTGRRI